MEGTEGRIGCWEVSRDISRGISWDISWLGSRFAVSNKARRVGAQRTSNDWLLALSEFVSVTVRSRIAAVRVFRALFVVSVKVSQAVGCLVSRRLRQAL